ncbi:MAG: adenylate kinase family protein [Candidatus Aenigmatarchaeota archaeon]
MKIAITGVPCSGKTTVSKNLAKKMKYEYVSLNDLAKSLNTIVGYDKKLKSKIVDVERIEKYIASLKGNYIIDGHFSHLLKVDLIIILRINPKILKKRLEKRYSKLKNKIVENLDAEVLGVISSECIGKNAWEIDVTNKNVEKIAGEIEKIILTKRKTKFKGSIDWLNQGFVPSYS